MNLAPALAVPPSGASSHLRATETALLRLGYAGAGPSLNPSLTEIRSRHGVLLGSKVGVKTRLIAGRVALATGGRSQSPAGDWNRTDVGKARAAVNRGVN